MDCGGGGLISAVLGAELPGPGAIYLSQSLKFVHPVGLGDTITATVTVVEKRAEHHRVRLDCRCTNQKGQDVITGQAEVVAPTEKVRRPRVVLPDVQLSDHDAHRQLMALTTGHQPVPTAIAHPCGVETRKVLHAVEIVDLRLPLDAIGASLDPGHAGEREGRVAALEGQHPLPQPLPTPKATESPDNRVVAEGWARGAVAAKVAEPANTPTAAMAMLKGFIT